MILGAEFFFAVEVVADVVPVAALGVPAAGAGVAAAVVLVADVGFSGIGKQPVVNSCSSVSEFSSEDDSSSENPADPHWLRRRYRPH